MPMTIPTEHFIDYNYIELLDLGFEDSIGLFYDRDKNVFIDEDGFIVWSIFEIITPNDLFLFKLNQEYMLVQHRTMPEVLVELYYPDGDDAMDRLIY